MDVGSGVGFPADDLSNFEPREFVVDGIRCGSMEGFLQSLKFEDEAKQKEVCLLSGTKAKFKGKKRNKAWKSRQVLWWKGVEIPRKSEQLQLLFDRAFEQLAGNEQFRIALLATGSDSLTHSIGHNRVHDTVLTEEEFCSRLTKIRDRLKESI